MGYNILVVDDSKTMRAVITKGLRAAGVPIDELHEAANGWEALTHLEAQWIDLVLTDLNMPEMNGMELVQEMAKGDTLQNTPVVVVSTEGSKTRIEELERHGIRGYLRKPFTPEDLKTTVEDILGVCHDDDAADDDGDDRSRF